MQIVQKRVWWLICHKLELWSSGTVVIEPDERMLLEIAAVMIQPLALVHGRFQVTRKWINFVLDGSVDVGDMYKGDFDDRYKNGTKAKDLSWLHEVYSRSYLL